MRKMIINTVSVLAFVLGPVLNAYAGSLADQYNYRDRANSGCYKDPVEAATSYLRSEDWIEIGKTENGGLETVRGQLKDREYHTYYVDVKHLETKSRYICKLYLYVYVPNGFCVQDKITNCVDVSSRVGGEE